MNKNNSNKQIISILHKKIDDFNRINIFSISLKNLSFFTSVILTIFLSIIITEYFYYLETEYRTVIFFSFISLLIILLIQTIRKILTESLNYRQDIRTSAKNIEAFITKNQSNNDLKKNKETDLLQLLDLISISDENQSNNDDDDKNNNFDFGDGTIISSAIKDFNIKFQKEIFPKLINKRKILSYIKYSALLLFLFLYAILLVPELQYSAERVLLFNKKFIKVSSHNLILSNSNKNYTIEGDSLLLSCKITGKFPEQVFFNKKSKNQNNWSKINLSVDKKDSVVHYKEQIVKNSFSYYFSSEETVSDTSSTDLFLLPKISKIKIEIIPPKYSRIAKENIEEIIGDIEVLKGTDIKFSITPEFLEKNNIDSILVIIINNDNEDNTRNKLEVINSKSLPIFKYSFDKIKNSKEFYFKIYSSYQLENKNNPVKVESINPIQYNLSVYDDEFPAVNLISPEDYFKLSENITIPLIAIATDDYGIRSFYLYSKKIAGDNFGFNNMPKSDNKDNKYTRTKLNFVKDEDDSYMVSTYFDLKEKLSLFPDDKVEIFVRVYDNDFVSGPKFSDSKHITLLLPTLDQLFSETEDSYKKQNTEAKDNLKKSKDLKKVIKDLTDQMKINKNLSWENRKKLENAINDQKKMLKNIDDIEKEIKENIKNIEKNSLLSKETMAKYMKLQKMVDKLFNEDLKKRLDKINELNKKGEDSDKELKKDELDKLLDDFKNQQKEFEEGLEKTIKILEQIVQEQKLDKLLKKINDLIERQDNENIEVENIPLNKKDEYLKKKLLEIEKKIESDYNTVKEEILTLKNDFQIYNKKSVNENKLKNSLDSISSNLSNNKIDNDFNEFNTNLDNISVGNKSSSENKDNKDKSVKAGGKILDKLTKIAENFEELKKNFTDMQKEDIDNEIKESIHNLLLLSTMVENLKNRTVNLSRNSPQGKDILIVNNNIEKGFNKVTDKIFETSQKTFFINQSIGATIANINNEFDAINHSLQNLRNFRQASKKQKKVMGYLNKLIYLLEQVRDEIKKSKSASGLDEMIKKMEEMAKKQEELNKDGEQGMKSQGNMPSPGMGGGQGGSPGGSQSSPMDKLAQEQAGLYEALQEMLDELGIGQDGKSSGKPGSEGQSGEEGGQNGKSGKGQGQSKGSGEGEGQGKDGNHGKNGKGKGQGQGEGSGKNGPLGKKLSEMSDSMEEILNEMKNKKMTESILNKQEKLLKNMLESVKSMKKEKMSKKRESKSTNLKALDPGKVEIFNRDKSLRQKLIRSLKDGYKKEYQKKIKEYFKAIE